MRLLTTALLSATLLLGLTATQAADAAAKTRVLLITGDDVSPAHDWLSCAAATRDVLQGSGQFNVDTVGSPEILAKADNLKTVDVIYFLMFNARTPTLSDAGKENLLNFVKGGKGFVVTHLASASFKEWPEFRKLCGRVWVMGTSGHGPRSVFKARVIDPNSPITKGVKDFDQDDELYAKLQGSDPIHVLLEADSDWSKAKEPLAFTLNYGQGRVFHHTFGHDAKAIHSPEVEKLIVQGTAWAAGK
jgi:type 1 glutamine amidotransferase